MLTDILLDEQAPSILSFSLHGLTYRKLCGWRPYSCAWGKLLHLARDGCSNGACKPSRPEHADLLAVP